jgi:predicted patatin/cPLA2 family phospholipase
VVVTRNRGYRAKKSAFSFFAYLRYPQYRRFAHAVANRFDYYNESLRLLEEQERQDAAVALYPSRPIEVTRFERDPDRMLALFENGYEDALAQKERLYAFLRDSENVEIR